MSTPLAVVERAKENKECTWVNIWDLHFGKGDIEKVFEVLNEAPHLENLEIHACVWSTGVNEGFGACLAQNKTLKKLTLMNVVVAEAWYLDLAEGLLQNVILEEINILRCYMIRGGDGRLYNPVFEGLRDRTTLKVIGFSENGFKFTEQASIGALMLRNPLLHSVDIGGNSIDDREAEVIASAIRASKTLEYLDVDRCNMSKKACVAIINAVADSTSIATLHINRNRGGNIVGEAVGRLFRKNHILETFQAHYTSLGRTGRVSAFKSLAVNDTIEMVYLHTNSGTTLEAKQIFKECISTNHNIRHIKYEHDAPQEKYFKRRMHFPQNRKLFPQLYYHCKNNHFLKNEKEEEPDAKRQRSV